MLSLHQNVLLLFDTPREMRSAVLLPIGAFLAGDLGYGCFAVLDEKLSSPAPNTQIVLGRVSEIQLDSWVTETVLDCPFPCNEGVLHRSEKGRVSRKV